MLMEFFDQYADEYDRYKGGSWCYEDGLLYRGLECLHRATGDPKWLQHLVRLISAQLDADNRIAGYRPEDFNIDNILPGRALLYLHRQTGEEKYLYIAAQLIAQLDDHPRTKSGVYWHKKRYPWQVWLDGLHMGHPFQIDYGLMTGNDALVDDALRQVETALELTYVSETGLYAHAFDEAREQKWADPVTGHPAAHWARALGWLAMALVDIAALVGDAKIEPLRAQTKTLFDVLAKHRQPGGLWLQVIDQPNLVGNYQEHSASAMFVYAFVRAKTLGLWDGSTDGLFDTLVAQSLRQNESGKIQMVDVCHVAGLGMYEGRYRDGSAAYYVSESCLDNDVKGVGPLMMAASLYAAKEKAEIAS